MYTTKIAYEHVFCLQQIAYEVGQLIDNGETVINRGGRINPDFGGKGLIHRLSQHVFDWGLSEGAKGNVFAVSDGYSYMSNPSFKRRTKYILTKVGISLPPNT